MQNSEEANQSRPGQTSLSLTGLTILGLEQRHIA